MRQTPAWLQLLDIHFREVGGIRKGAGVEPLDGELYACGYE